MPKKLALDKESIKRRRLILEVLEKSRRGHVGSALSIVEILRVLYENILQINPKNPRDVNRDRFILSKGHGCIALYVELAIRGFFPNEALSKFCAFDGILGGHPEVATTPGVEASTGSLGHGLPIGVGLAVAAKIDKKTYRTYVLLGDGECEEGTVWEAALLASKHKLDNLTVLVDYNKMQCYASTKDVCDLEPFAAKWTSFGFAVKEVDGHDIVALRKILSKVPFSKKKPSLLICHTTKGKGISAIEQNTAWHHKAKVSDDEMAKLRRSLEESL